MNHARGNNWDDRCIVGALLGHSLVILTMIEWIREFLELRYVVIRGDRIVFMTGDRQLAQYYADGIPGARVHRKE